MHSFIERVESAIQDLQQGKLIIMTDNEDRENEGDFIMPAELVTPELMNFIIRNSSGIVCLALLDEQLKKLNLPLMVESKDNSSMHSTPFTISIDAKNGVTTGVSAHDRVVTILEAIKDKVTPEDIVKPGHIFPLKANSNGVLARNGHTEGSIDIARLAGFQPAAILCEVMNEDGTMARGEKLQQFADLHNIKMLSIADLVAYRLHHENLISEEASALLPTKKYGDFTITVIKEKITGLEHVVLTNNIPATNPLVRIHSSCLTGDLFSSLRCDCNLQLEHSLQRIQEEGGVLIYLNQEGRGIGLFNKIKAYALQENGFDTVEANHELGLPADLRSYAIAANVLRNLNIHEIRLLTNNPEKIHDLNKYGIKTVQTEKMPLFSNCHNKKYLLSKKEKLNHLINEVI